MAKRRETSTISSSERLGLNKQIAKIVRRDLRSSNTRLIKEAIERNRGSKVFTQQLGRSHLTKLTTHDGRTFLSKPGVITEIEDFYGRLYATHAPCPQWNSHDSIYIRFSTIKTPELQESVFFFNLHH